MVQYKILTKTGTVDGAGTDANIYINIFGTNGTTGEMELENPNRNDFEKGHLDDFYCNSIDVGDIQSITMRNNMTHKYAGWYLEYVQVSKNGEKDITFTYNQWLEENIAIGKNRD